MKYELISNSNGKSKIPVGFKAEVVRRTTQEGMTAKEAMTSAADEWKLELAKSYMSHSSSHLSRFRKEIQKKLTEGSEEVIALCLELGIVQK